MTPQTVYSTEAKPKPPKLLDQVREKLRLKHYSIRTESQYVQWIRRFILFHGMEFPLSHGRLSAEEFSAVTVVFSTGDCPDCALICSNSLGAR